MVGFGGSEDKVFHENIQNLSDAPLVEWPFSKADNGSH
jgi:hypothetical protein